VELRQIPFILIQIKIPIDVVKAVLSLSFGAFAAGKSVYVTYDCSFGGGYGWGVGISVTK